MISEPLLEDRAYCFFANPREKIQAMLRCEQEKHDLNREAIAVTHDTDFKVNPVGWQYETEI